MVVEVFTVFRVVGFLGVEIGFGGFLCLLGRR